MAVYCDQNHVCIYCSKNKRSECEYYQEFHPHFKIADPQVRPAPNPAAAIIWPALTFPLRTDSSKAKGMEAALVLPYSATFDITFSDGTSNLAATESMILWFAYTFLTSNNAL